MTATPMQLEDWLDDLCVRFIINLPQEDLSSVARICFQVEEAQWFYEDFIRPLNPNLPSMSLRTFCLRIFQHCPLLASFSVENHTKAFEEFLQYKTRVPVRGAIMLNQEMDSVVLVKGWKKGANWSFPRGKINKDEDDLDCAVREVYEETGLDLRAAGLVPTEKKPKYIEISMREQQLRLYVFRDVPMDTKFQPRTRKEISKIQWYKLSELPAFRKKGAQSHNESSGPSVNKFYMVAPFLFALKKWIGSQKRIEEKRATSGPHHLLPHHVADELVTTEDDTWAPTNSQQQAHVPAIETLDGATRELQRLLKMQPPTQGLQPPSSQPPQASQASQASQFQEDKGSALLSILQSNNPRPSKERHQSATPHTSSQAAPSDVAQPHNPHHHTNLYHGATQTQHPPPSFPIPQSHESFMRDSAVATQLQHSSSFSYHRDHRQQQLNSPSHEQHVHLQPYGMQPHGLNSPLASYQQTTPSQQHTSNSMNSSFYMSSAQASSSRQSHQLSAAPGSAKLSGASLALLNAFKRETVPAAVQSPPKSSHANPAGPSGSSGQTRTEQMEQASVSGPVDSFVQPSADQHRSTLLGMFKKSPSGVAPPTNQPPAAGSAAAANQSPTTIGQDSAEVTKMEVNVLLSQAQDNRGPGGQNITALEQLSLHVNASASAPSPSPHGTNQTRSPYQQYSQQYSNPQLHWQQQQKPQKRQQRHAKSPFAPGPNVHQPPAPRILQRGQNINDLDDPLPPQRTASTRASASPFSSQLPPVQTAPGRGEFSGSAPVGGGYKPEGARDQKNQLLSLFGKPQPSATERTEAGERPRSRISSIASRGGEAPISSAEQTFLLGYLQSVTNSAARR
ncbi:hypothetical protein E4U42_005118 [Claviceps africana]|uniref:Nudix hydrolase domain-containing protein n=1 Tax=Claviceps africana TaxID=83212 RepID=A0A8K0J408_9HYPO|nr:hypothetical protein E4U42_005118 [Claviceps africana]